MKTFAHLDFIPDSGVIANKEGEYLSISFDFEKVEKQADEMDKTDYSNYYQYEHLFIKDSSYGAIVSAIINDRYTLDDVQAIIANYEDAKEQSEPSDKDKEHISEYEEYQAFRKHAKEVAKLIV